ncbi:hypothetical protein BDP55DRAFT_720196 [Colletotrichum godetiae]|uniref:Uncharacterized protein n=1 Tax=Colletotrichum godetiae TaxID=1209918 RepID=A0AAJ0AAI8_9PEZI|nr:uncharacterized protein BDP55DRAFT_720196 [Colletotrichum godetiae]KAK1658964.1 hypothetical protein BDP55DRAFT_720196 [Colletotrichum godetiae]
MINLADSTWAVGEREKALLLSQRCLDLREKALSPQDPRLFRTRRKVAGFLCGLYHRRRALDLRELTFRDTKLKDCPTDAELLDFLATKTALADSYQWDGRYLQTLQLRRGQFGLYLHNQEKVHLFPYLSTIGKLASLFRKTGQFFKARRMRLTAAKLAELLCGVRDPVTFMTINKLLTCENAMHHITSEELIEKREKLLSDQTDLLRPRTPPARPPTEIHPSIFKTMSFLAVDLEKAKYEAKAIELRRELLTAQKVALGPENQETLRNMKTLALMLTDKHTSNIAQAQEGIKLLEEIEAVQQRLLGSDSFQARDTRMEISRIQSTSHFGESARIQMTDIPESGSDTDKNPKITSSSDREIQDGRKDEEGDTEESDSSLDRLSACNRTPIYLLSLLPGIAKRKGNSIRYSDSSDAYFTRESGSEASEG